jgi:hypothetical protein
MVLLRSGFAHRHAGVLDLVFHVLAGLKNRQDFVYAPEDSHVMAIDDGRPYSMHL